MGINILDTLCALHRIKLSFTEYHRNGYFRKCKTQMTVLLPFLKKKTSSKIICSFNHLCVFTCIDD